MPTPDGKPMLSEKLIEIEEWLAAGASRSGTSEPGWRSTLREAARRVAPLESAGPEVEELLKREKALRHLGHLQWAKDLHAHAACLVARKDAEVKLAKAERALRDTNDWWDDIPACQACIESGITACATCATFAEYGPDADAVRELLQESRTIAEDRLARAEQAEAKLAVVKIPAAALCFMLRCSEFEHPRTVHWDEFRQVALVHVATIEAALRGEGVAE